MPHLVVFGCSPVKVRHRDRSIWLFRRPRQPRSLDNRHEDDRPDNARRHHHEDDPAYHDLYPERGVGGPDTNCCTAWSSEAFRSASTAIWFACICAVAISVWFIW